MQNKDINSGKISIGISLDIESSVLQDKIIRFKEKYDNATFKIVNLPAKDLVEKLSHYTLDFVIDEKSDSYKKSSGVKSIDLFDEEYCLVYLKDKFEIKSINDLNEKPLILPISTKQERKLMDEYLSNNDLIRNLSIETSNYYSSIEYAKNGLGIALIPKSMVDNSLEVFNLLGFNSPRLASN